ncbi:MAG TPA: AMP-binding protein, partial [Enhygromyxa sp.]|nr:AMP-binding protein [Enhygromyxa sp.]
IYHTASIKQVRYILDHSGAKLLFVAVDQDAAALELTDRPALAHTIAMRPGQQQLEGVDDWQAFARAGEQVSEAELDARIAALGPADLASIVYTSGTTGQPKGAMLTHGNLLWSSQQLAGIAQMSSADSLVSYLPLAHIAEQLASVYLPPVGGCAVWMCESLGDLRTVLAEVQPTLVFGVPQVWERFEDGVLAKLAEASPTKRLLFRAATTIGRQASDRTMAGQPLGGPLALAKRGADRLVLDPVRRALGLGRVRWALSGAAASKPSTLEFFAGLGIVLLEGYGMTETTAPSANNRPGATAFGTVGKPLDGVEIRQAEDGELLVRGPNVFAGYFADPAASEAALRDGWYHTGDLGRVDAAGFVTLTGRKKDLIITSNGKNVAPGPIERALEADLAIARALLVGDGRPHVGALLWMAPGFETDQRAAADAVGRVNADLSRAEQIRVHRIVDTELSVEDGQLTATLKLRRHRVVVDHAPLIDELYAS